MDEDVRPTVASHRGRAGDEGRDVARLGPLPVLQYLVRPGHFLSLDTGLSHSQLDAGGEETQLKI